MLGGDFLVMVGLIAFGLADFKRLPNAVRVLKRYPLPALQHFVRIERKQAEERKLLHRPFGLFRIVAGKKRLVRRVEEKKIHYSHLSRYLMVPVPVMVCVPFFGVMKCEPKV